MDGKDSLWNILIGSVKFLTNIFYSISNLVVWQNHSELNILIEKERELEYFSLGWMKYWVFLTFHSDGLTHKTLGQPLPGTHLQPHADACPLSFSSLLCLVCRSCHRKWQSPMEFAYYMSNFPSLSEGLHFANNFFLVLLESILDTLMCQPNSNREHHCFLLWIR